MKTTSCCFVFGLLLLVRGCEMFLNKPDEVSSVDITDAVYLGIDRGNDFDSDLNAELQNNLVKFTSNVQDGRAVSVDFYDESGEPVRNAFIYAYTDRIALLSERYTVIWGDFRFTLKGGDTHSNALLLDHETGVLTDLVYEYYPNITNSYLGSKYHQQDQYGNIYYLGAGGIRRLLVQDPDNIQIDYYMDYSPIDIYFVDLKGNVFIQSGKKVKLATGGIIEAGPETKLCFNGFNDSVYGLVSGLKVLEFIISEQSIEMNVVASFPIPVAISDFTHYYPDSVSKKHFFCFTDIPKSISTSNSNRIAGICFDETDEKIYLVQLPSDISGSYRFFGLEDNYLWIQDISNNLRLFAIDLRSYSESGVSDTLNLTIAIEGKLPEDLQIESLFFNPGGVIEFIGYDLLNEKRINGFLSMVNGIEYYEEPDEGPLSLYRIR